MKTALLLKADGTQQEITPKNGKHFKLAELQGYVGGYVEILHMPTDDIFVVHDEGKFLFPRNEAATKLWYESYAGQDADFQGDYLCGDVIMCHTKMIK